MSPIVDFVGAALIVSTLGLQPLWSALAYAALVSAGIVVQSRFTGPGARGALDRRA